MANRRNYKAALCPNIRAAKSRRHYISHKRLQPYIRLRLYPEPMPNQPHQHLSIMVHLQ